MKRGYRAYEVSRVAGEIGGAPPPERDSIEGEGRRGEDPDVFGNGSAERRETTS